MMTPYSIAQSEIGTTEIRGDEDNPRVVQYFADVGHSWVQDDETAWCAAFVGSCLKRGGYPHTGSLGARSYLDWGQPVALQDAEPGDIVVFWRGSPSSWQGHVGFFAGVEKGGDIMVLGGNQKDKVGLARYSQSRLLGVRRADQEVSPAKGSTPRWLLAILALIKRIVDK